MLNHAHLALYSPTGTSLQIGKTFATALGIDNCTVVDATHQTAGEMVIEDFAIFVVPVYAGRVAAVAKERLAGLRGNNTPCVIIVVYGNRDYDDALVELEDMVKEAGFVPMAAAACIAEHSYSSATQPIASGRPDLADEKALEGFAAAVRIKLGGEDFSVPDIPGNRPYRDGVGFAPFHPVSGSSCDLCGECVELCPTQAISLGEDEPQWQKGRCTLCCACIKGCPNENLWFEEQAFLEIADMLYKNCKNRREPEFFLGVTPNAGF